MITHHYKIELIKKLSSKKNKHNFSELINYLHDKNEVVRVEAIEALDAYIESLKKEDISFLLKDKSYLVRGYALDLYGQVLKSESQLLSIIDSENSMYVKLSGYISLCQLGHKKYLQDIIAIMLKSKQYRVRCAAVNSLSGFVDQENYKMILNALLKLKKKESTVAVLSSLKSAFAIIDEYEKKSI